MNIAVMNKPQVNTTGFRCNFGNQCHSHTSFNDDNDDFETELTTARTMKDEGRRLMSYEKWPPFTCQLPSSLAEAGFYYTGSVDRVKCAFCLGVLKKWQPDDVPFVEHKNHFPYCKFAKGEDVGNIPLRKTGIEQVLEITKREEPKWKEAGDLTSEMTFTKYEGRRQNYKTEPSRIFATTSKPFRSTLLEYRKFPQYNFSSTTTPTNQNSNNAVAITPSTCRQNIEKVSPPKPQKISSKLMTSTDYTYEANRLASFLGWPADSKLQPEDVARAGFYFVPTDAKPDRVKCGYCGGKLYGWQEGDDPMVEHSRCFPECPYIKLCVEENNQQRMKQTLTGTSETKSPDISPDHASDSRESVEKVEYKRSDILSTARATQQKGTFVPDVYGQYLDIATNPGDNDVTVVMRSSTVRAVIAMGFPREKVTQTVREQTQKGNNVLTVHELLNVLL